MRQEIDTGWPSGIRLLTTRQLRNFLSQPTFADQVVEVINRTGQQIPDRKTVYGQEFGFFGYRYPGINRKLYLSSILEGGDGYIDMGWQTHWYLKDNAQPDAFESFELHGHPNYQDEEIGELAADIYSDTDLDGFWTTTRFADPSLIYALVTRNRRTSGGRLLMISFADPLTYKKFDSETVYHKSIEYILAGKPYIDVYKDAGLNVATLNVRDSLPRLDQQEIEVASMVLTSRS